MANKKIKRVNLNGTEYDLAVDSVDKVDGLEERLDKLEEECHSEYIHPTYTSKAEGLYKVTVDGTGHVSATTAVTKSDITALGIPGSDTTYSSKAALSGGTAVSLVTTGEKYTWNNKQAAISDLSTIRSNASSGAAHAATTHARTDATKVEDSTTNGNIKINGTETNVYTHPAYTAKESGLYKVTVDNTGHISDATAVTKTDITNLGIPGSNTNTTYDLAAATSKSNGSVTLDLTAGGSGSGKDSVIIKGTGATTVTTDANGVITINSTDNNTVYTHPTHTAKESGLYKVTVDNAGHVSAATAVTKSDITSLGIPGSDTNTTYTIATGDSNGQIKVTPSSGDAYNVSVKGLGSAAYTNSSTYMPAGDTSHGTHVTAATVKSALGTGTGTSKYLREDGTWVTPPNTTYSNATTSKAGLMSATDKSNLNTLVTAWTADGTDDTLINKVQEVLTAFENAPEGTNIVEALAEKSKVGHNHEVSTASVAPSGHTHTVTVSGTTGNNSGSAVKAVTGYANFSGGSGSLTSNTTSTDGIKYVEAISGGSAVSKTTKYMKFSAGTTPKSGATPVHTSTNSGANSGTAVTALTGVKVTAQPTIGLTANTATATDRIKYVEAISGGSGSLEAYDAATNGTKKVSNGTRIPFITSLSKDGYTPAGSVSLTNGTAPSMNFNTGTTTDTPYISALTNGSYTPAGSVSLTNGTAPSMGAATTKYLHFSAGTTPKSGATPNTTSTNSGSAGGGTASQNTGSATPTFTGSEVTSGGSTVITAASVSGGVLTLTSASHTHKVTAAGSVGAHTHTYTKPAAHTHTYDKTTSISLTDGTAPSLTANTTASGGIQYVHSQGTFSAGTTPKKSASFSGTATTALVTSGTTKYMKFSAGTTPKSSASFTGTNSTAVVTGGTTYYLAHGHTGAGATTKYLSASASGTAVGANGTASVAPSEHTHTYDKTTSITLTAGTAPSMNFNTGTTTDTPYISAVSGGSAVSATTKYLHHTHTGASLGTASIENAAPHTHTHSYGSSTALTTTTNSGTAISAVTDVEASVE